MHLPIIINIHSTQDVITRLRRENLQRCTSAIQIQIASTVQTGILRHVAPKSKIFKGRPKMKNRFSRGNRLSHNTILKALLSRYDADV